MSNRQLKKNDKEVDLQKVAEYRDFRRKHPKLRFLFFELTDSCNLNCLHCGSNCQSSNIQFLDFNLIKKTLDEVADAYDTSDIWIELTGGEPALFPDLPEVIRYSKKLGFQCGMTSNGTLITEELAKKIADAGLDTIAVSIDGFEESHEEFRNRKGCFEKALCGIDNLRKVGIQAEALTVIHKKNFDELEDLFEFLSDNYFYSWRLVNIEPIGRAKTNNELLLDAGEMEQLLDFIQEKRLHQKNSMNVSFGCSHFLPTKYEHEVRDWYFHCLAGIEVASVMVNGDICSCLDIERRPELVQGNVKVDDFIDVWENKFIPFRSDRTQKSRICASCKDRKICGGDSTHTWNFDLNEPNYCVRKMLEKPSFPNKEVNYELQRN